MAGNNGIDPNPIPKGWGRMGNNTGIGTGKSFVADPGGTLPPSAGSGAAAGLSGMGAAAGGEAIILGGIVLGTAALSTTIGTQLYESAAVPGSVGNAIASRILEAPIVRGYLGVVRFFSDLLPKPGQSTGGQIIQKGSQGVAGKPGQVPGQVYRLSVSYTAQSINENGVAYTSQNYTKSLRNVVGPISYTWNPNGYWGHPTLRTWKLIINGSEVESNISEGWSQYLPGYNSSYVLVQPTLSMERLDGTSQADDIAADPNAKPSTPEVKKPSKTTPTSRDVDGGYFPDGYTSPSTSPDPPPPPQPPAPPTLPIYNWPDILPKKDDNKFGRVADIEWDRIATEMAGKVKKQPGAVIKRKGAAPQIATVTPIAPYRGKKPEYPKGTVLPTNGGTAKLPAPIRTPTAEKRPDRITTPGAVTPIAPYRGKKKQELTPPIAPYRPKKPAPIKGRITTPTPVPTPTETPKPTGKPKGRVKINPSDLKPKRTPFPEFNWETGVYETDKTVPKPKPDPTTDKIPKFDWKSGAYIDPVTKEKTNPPAEKSPFPSFPPIPSPPILQKGTVTPVDPKTNTPVKPEPKPNTGTVTPPTNGTGSGGGTCAYPGYHGAVMGGHSATQGEVAGVSKGVEALTNVHIKAVGDNVTAVKNAIGSPVIEGAETLFKGVDKIKELADKAIKSSVVDRALNIIGTAAAVHNAAMLSRDLGTTLMSVLSKGLEIVGIKDANGQAFDMGQIIGHKIEDFVKGIVGADNYAKYKKEWIEANRILTVANQLLDAVRAEHSAIMQGVEVVANATSQLSNAAKSEGLFNDDLLNFQPNNHEFNTHFTKSTMFLQGMTEAAQQIEALESAVLEERETRAELTKNWNEFGTEITNKIAEKTAEEAAKDALNLAPVINPIDLVRYEPEILGDI